MDTPIFLIFDGLTVNLADVVYFRRRDSIDNAPPGAQTRVELRGAGYQWVEATYEECLQRLADVRAALVPGE